MANFLSSLWSSFSGSGAKKTAGQTLTQQTQAATAAREGAVNAAKAGGSEARGYLNPYAQQGGKAFGLYHDTLGTNGVGAREAAQGLYLSDPILAAMRQGDLVAQQRKDNATGRFNSGVGALADAAIRQRSYGDWQNRLQGAGQQGQAAAGGLADIAQREAGMIGGAYGQYGQTMNNAYGQYGQMMGQANNALAQNTIGLTGAIVSGFTPGRNGTTPFGNMASGISSGVNNLARYWPGATS